MEAAHSILVFIDDEMHRHACVRAEELQLSLPELAAAVLENAVEKVDISEDSLGHSAGADEHNLDQVIGEIRAAHPGFRASDNLPRDELYRRIDGDRTQMRCHASSTPMC